MIFRLDNLLNEKENLQREYNAFQREVKHSSVADTSKEIRVLKKVIKNLEVCKRELDHSYSGCIMFEGQNISF